MTKLTLPESFQESKPKLSKLRPTGFRWLTPQFDATSTAVAWQWLLQEDLVRYPNLVCCPFHDQERPRVLLVHEGDKLPLLVCSDSRAHGLSDKLKFKANIAEVYYRITTSAEPDAMNYLSSAGQHMWATRLLVRTKLVNPDPYQLWPRNPERLRQHLTSHGAELTKRGDWTKEGAQGISDTNLVKTYCAVREMSMCSGLLHQNAKLPFSRKFVAGWANVTPTAAHKATQLLRVTGLLELIGTIGHQPKLRVDGTKLPKPPSHRPINIFQAHPFPR